MVTPGHGTAACWHAGVLAGVHGDLLPLPGQRPRERDHLAGRIDRVVIGALRSAELGDQGNLHDPGSLDRASERAPIGS